MKTTNILLSVLLITGQFIFAQRSDCDKYEVKEKYNFNTRQYKDLDVFISYGLGELTVGPSGETDIIEGFIQYDNSSFSPKVSMESISSSGVLTIKSEKDHGKDPCNRKLKDFENELEFYFPPQIKTDLFLDFGVGDASIDLTNIAITKLNINCGLSDAEIEINEQNTVRCESVDIENGLGDIEVYGLGNLSAKTVNISVGLGSADIDFSGDNIYNTDINVDVGLGSLGMTLPKNVNIKVYVDASFLSSVDIYGLKQKKDKYWISPNWDSDDPTISMDIDVGMGSIDIIVEE